LYELSLTDTGSELNWPTEAMNIMSIFSILLLRIVFILYFFVDIEN